MSIWEKITGSDMTKEMKGFELRVKKLPEDYVVAWEDINTNLWEYSDFTGRNLMKVMDNILCMLEETAYEGKNVEEVLGDDIKGFCLDIVGECGVKSMRDKWRKQLNNNIAKKIGK